MGQKLYDVTDAKTGEILYTGISKAKLCEVTGIGVNYVRACIVEHTAYKGLYYIDSRELESRDERFRGEWLKITGMLKRYRGLDRVKLVIRYGDGDSYPQKQAELRRRN